MAKKKKRHTGKNIAYMCPEKQQKRAQPSCSAMLILEDLFVAVDFFTVAIRSYRYTIFTPFTHEITLVFIKKPR